MLTHAVFFFRLLLLFDYSKGYFFTNLNDHAASTVREALKQKNIECPWDASNIVYSLPKEKALEFDVQYVLLYIFLSSLAFLQVHDSINKK